MGDPGRIDSQNNKAKLSVLHVDKPFPITMCHGH